MNRLRNTLKYQVNMLQKQTGLNLLSSKEESGFLDFSSKFKLFRGSQINAPFSLGRTIRGVAFDLKKLDPYSRCLLNYDAGKIDVDHFSKTILQTFVKEQDYIISDFIPNFEQNCLSKMPGWTISFPWELFGIKDREKEYLELLAENRKMHLDSVNPEAKNHIDVIKYARSQALQFAKLGANLKVNGFNPNFERPGGYILKKDNSWRWVMTGNGNHRAYLMSRLGETHLPITIKKVVDRAQSNRWPNVINGEYSKSEAEMIFDLVFDGKTRIRGCV